MMWLILCTNTYLSFNSRWSFRSGRDVRRSSDCGQRRFHAGPGIRSLRQGRRPQRDQSHGKGTVHRGGEVVHHWRKEAATILHAVVLGNHTGKQEEGFRVSCCSVTVFC